MTAPEPLSRDTIADEVRRRVAEAEITDPVPEVISNALTPRAEAISDWLLAATIHGPDGVPLVENFALLGNRETADEYAEKVDAFLAAGGDEPALVEWMLDLNRGGGAVRAYQLAPFIAADLMAVLRDLGFA